MKYTFNLHYYIFLLSQQSIFSFVLKVRTMHSSVLRSLECIALRRGAKVHCDTSDTETGSAETSERERIVSFSVD